MSDVTRLFVDFEMTGLHQYTTPISVGICTEDREKTFYAEFTDFDKDQVDDWLQANVVDKLILPDDIGLQLAPQDIHSPHVLCKSMHPIISNNLKLWLSQFEKIEFWVDCGPYDTMLLNSLIAEWSGGYEFNEITRTRSEYRIFKQGFGYPVMPKNVPFHTPFDLVNLFKERGKDPDVNREQFILDHTVVFDFASEIRTVGDDYKHNALWDAKVMSACFEILQMLK